MSNRPRLTIVGGPEASGKTTVLGCLREEAAFGDTQIVELGSADQGLPAALLAALQARNSLVIESRLDSPTVLMAMIKAAEMGYDVDLILVDVDSVDVLDERLARMGRRVRGSELEARLRCQHHMPAAVDLARRVLLIDNSASLPVMHELVSGAQQQAQADLSAPKWFADKVVTAQLNRAASREALKQYRAVGGIRPLLQKASPLGQPTQGMVVVATKHHALQQVGQALHLVHDLALLPMGAGALAVGALALINYQAEQDRDAAEAERQARSAQRPGPDLGPVRSKEAHKGADQGMAR